MRNLVVNILIPLILLINCNSAIAIAELQLIKRISGINIFTTKFLIKFRIFLNQLHLI